MVYFGISYCRHGHCKCCLISWLSYMLLLQLSESKKIKDLLNGAKINYSPEPNVSLISDSWLYGLWNSQTDSVNRTVWVYPSILTCNVNVSLMISLSYFRCIAAQEQRGQTNVHPLELATVRQFWVGVVSMIKKCFKFWQKVSLCITLSN